MQKTLIPVMLPTTDKGKEGMLSTAYGSLDKPFGQLLVLSRMKCGNKYFDTDNQDLFDYKPQHLYLTYHEEKIRKGDWLYNDRLPDGEKLFQATDNHVYTLAMTGFTKVVATTDEKLNLMAIPAWFLQHYANQQGKVESVESHWMPLSNLPLFNAMGEVMFVH